MNELGNKIKLWRNYRKLTLEQLNAITGIHFARLSKFERGVEIPNQAMLLKIEKALDIKFEDLVIIDNEIEHLVLDFIDTIFFLRMDFDRYVNTIEANREKYMLNQNYYKIELIEYIIAVFNNQMSEVSQLEKSLEGAVEPNTLYEQLYLEYKAVNLHASRKFNEAFTFIEKALRVSNYHKNNAMINYHLSLLHHGCGNYEQSRKYLICAKQMFIDGFSYKRAINCDAQMANIYTRMGYYDLAIELQLSSLEVYKYMNVDSRTVALVLRNTAWVYILKKDYNSALTILEEAERLEPKNGILILYKIWCNYSTNKFNTAKKIISENQELCKITEYRDRFKLFEYLVNREHQKPTKQMIDHATKLYIKLAEEKRYANMFFYLDILIDLLDKAGDKDELIHYLKIKGRLGK